MASLLEKVGLLVSANLHDLVNSAIRSNGVAVIEEHIRRAHESLEQLESTMAEIMGDLRIQQRKQRELTDTIAGYDRDINALVAAGKDGLAAVRIKQKQDKVAAKGKCDSTVADMSQEVERLQQAKAALEMKISELQATRDNVAQALQLAKTKNKVVRTFEDITDVLEESDAAGIEDWAMRVQAKAEVTLQMTLEKHGALLDPLADPGVAAELARIKATLGVPPAQA